MDQFLTFYNNVGAKGMIRLLACIHGIFSFCLLMSMFPLLGISNAAFNIFLTSIIYICYCTLSLYITSRDPRSIMIGMLMGMSLGLIVLSLMTAIYWGQLSDCKEISYTIKGYSCSHKGSMRSISVFSSFSFITELCIFIALAAWKEETDFGTTDDDIGIMSGDIQGWTNKMQPSSDISYQADNNNNTDSQPQSQYVNI